ncbi:PREDICTED: ninja-family protein AFP4 [Tarenaya hassleriana]|uniref:ninja-family protein AFP4 n=1 Tax=Tarenaya hassleriana TaxID=28532 RepID=UPI00053C115B|nr:PREDICTED: ninja-family protein AFP4 [Tarenaya hassleriana]
MEMANKNGVVRVPNPPANGLQRVVVTNKHICYRNPGNANGCGGEEEGDAIELSLGLSSNGRFGTDPGSRKRKSSDLTRSSSIPEGFTAGETRPPMVPRVSDLFQMTRTLSLPVDSTEEERRRRVEERRKRSEKTRAFRESDTPPRPREDTHVGNNEDDGGECRSIERNGHGGTRGSNGGCSNSGSDDIHGKGEEEREGRRARKILEKMPMVRTREAGPDGKRVEGFLYWFGGREDVRIVCVCHGLFLSPSEFLCHGGSRAGNRLLNPLRHIVVTPPPLSN